MPIARDGVGVQTGSANTTVTLTSVTVNGPNPILWVGIRADGETSVTVTYNGQTMYQPVNAHRQAFTTDLVSLYYITGVTGTHNVVVTGSTSNFKAILAMAFSGAAQITGEPDASGNQFSNPAGNTNDTLTTIADNAWIVSFEEDETTGTSSAVLPAVQEITNGPNALYDQGPYTPAGSNSLTRNQVHGCDSVYASFAPVSSGPIIVPPLWAQSLM